VFTGFIRDLTERHRTETQLEELQSELIHVARVSAMGTMASTLAHELNQPLAAASNYIAACKRLVARLEGEQKQAVVSGLAESEAQIQRTGEIIRHARDMIRNAGAKREPASLNGMIDRVTSALQASGQCGDATIRTDIERDCDEVEVNRIQIEQVLMNLLRNACQAAAPDIPEITISGRSEVDWCIVAVRDRSGGIPAERLKSLFSGEVLSSHGGLGLGLSICRTIVESHGGRIWAENNDEGGATFFFRVPRSS
jgi:two-component system sensor kinase FixL